MQVLYFTETAPPRPLPDRIVLANGRVRDDRDTFTSAEIADAGYILAPAKPVSDPVSERVVWDFGTQSWKVENLPPPPIPKARALSRLEFTRLCMSAGGMTPEMLVQAKAAQELAALWIMLDMALEILKDDPEVPPGLVSLEELGFLPNGAQAVLDAWPQG